MTLEELLIYFEQHQPNAPMLSPNLSYDLASELLLTYEDSMNQHDTVIITPTGVLWRVSRRRNSFDSDAEAIFPGNWQPGDFLTLQDIKEGWDYALDVINQESG